MGSKVTDKKHRQTVQRVLKKSKAEIDKLRNASAKDFKNGVVEILIGLLEGFIMAQEQNWEERDCMLKLLQKRFTVMDLGFDKLKETNQNLRFFLLIQTARAEYAYRKLTEIGIVEDWTDELRNMIWDDAHVRALGFDCTPEELKQIYGENLKNLKCSRIGKQKNNLSPSDLARVAGCREAPGAAFALVHSGYFYAQKNQKNRRINHEKIRGISGDICISYEGPNKEVPIEDVHTKIS